MGRLHTSGVKSDAPNEHLADRNSAVWDPRTDDDAYPALQDIAFERRFHSFLAQLAQNAGSGEASESTSANHRNEEL